MTLSELQKLRAKLIRMGHDEIPGLGNRAAEIVYEAIVDQMLSQLDLDQGHIINNTNNIRLISSMDSIFAKFKRKEVFKFANKVISDLEKLKNLNKQYFGIIRQDEAHQEVISESSRRHTEINFSTSSGWSDIQTTVNKLVNSALGVTASGNIKDGGFFDKFVNNNRVRNELKQMAMSAVNRQLDLKQFNKQIKTQLLGRPGVDGSMAAHYRRFTFDLYQQTDRLSQKQYAKNLSLKAFRYAGVRIQTSRTFCIKRKDKIFAVSETRDWKNDPDLPKTIKEGDTAVGYDPLTQLGRWECIDHTNFMTDERAKRLRQDIEDFL